jgi:hypothetical protein
MPLYAKLLERGRFLRPSPADWIVAIGLRPVDVAFVVILLA